MTVKEIKTLLTIYLNEYASSNDYKVREQALKCIDAAYATGLSDGKSARPFQGNQFRIVKRSKDAA